MTKVFCQKYKKELTKLNSPPFPGAVGQEIFDKYSKEAWDEWLSLQTMLINEGGLDLSVKENIKQRFEGFGEDIFRSDISSSQIRISEDS
jgi:Fe-S cluster biosynthesis and repair protein YggX